MTGSISVLDKPAATHGLIGLRCQPDGVKTFPARASASHWDGGSRAEGRSRERKTPAVHGRRVSLPFVPFSAAKRRGHDPRLPISQQLLNNGLSGVKAGVLWIYKFPFSARETTSWLVYPPKPCHMCRNCEGVWAQSEFCVISYSPLSKVIHCMNKTRHFISSILIYPGACAYPFSSPKVILGEHNLKQL